MAESNTSGTGNASDGAPIIDRATLAGNGTDGDFSGSDGDGTPDNPRDPGAAVKRGRGRPRKDGSLGADSGTGHEKGTRSGESGPKKSTQLDIKLFGSQLVGFHLIVAKLTKNPLFEISQNEGESLAQAIKDVMVFHHINISPSTIAYIKLIGALIAVYAPRVALTMAAMKAQRESNLNTVDAQGNVI